MREANPNMSRPRRVLILAENLPSPFDRRVWQEARSLRDAGYLVSIICPTGRGYERKFEAIDGIHIYRYKLPVEASGAAGYALEYAIALAWTFALSWRVLLTRGFDVVHACNPPDLFFLIGGFFKLFGKKFVFDHHDLNPELYEAKFGRRDFFHRLMLELECWTFRSADVSIATNESYRRIAIGRGQMPPERLFVVRSGPSLKRLKILPPDKRLKRGRRYLVGYVGVMGKQEGIDYLLRAARHIVVDLQRADVHFGLVGGGTSLEARKAATRLSAHPSMREKMTLSISRRSSSSCWMTRSGAQRWGNSGADAWRTNSNGTTKRRNCSPPTRHFRRQIRPSGRPCHARWDAKRRNRTGGEVFGFCLSTSDRSGSTKLPRAESIEQASNETRPSGLFGLSKN